MAAHKWEPLLHGDARDLMEGERRVCEICGKTQYQLVEYWYMRIVSRRWRPKVGRCPGKIEGGDAVP